MFDLAFIEDKSPFALHGDGSAPNNSTSENYVQKVTGGPLGFRIIKIQGQKVSYHQIDIECDFIDPQNTRNHLLSITLSQIIINVFKIAYGGHFGF